MNEENNLTKARNSNFELLRILSMLLIVIGHFAAHGIKQVLSLDEIECFSWLLQSTVNRLTVCAMLPGGRIGVMIFFMIPGYFLTEQKSEGFYLLAKKTKPLIIEVLFYSWLGLFLLFLLKLCKLQVNGGDRLKIQKSKV